MEIRINGNLRELKFGIGFVRKINSLHKVPVDGVDVSFGIGFAATELAQYNPSMLADVIWSAAEGNPSMKQVDRAIEEYAEENDGLESLFDEVNDEMGKSSIVKTTLEKFRGMTREQEEKEQNSPMKK